MTSAYSVPVIYQKQIQAVVNAGYYSNKSEVVRDALRNFFEEKTRLRLTSAIELYKEKEVTLSRAAEIAELSLEEFKEVLRDRGIKVRTVKQSAKELKAGLKLIKRNR